MNFVVHYVDYNITVKNKDTGNVVLFNTSEEFKAALNSAFNFKQDLIDIVINSSESIKSLIWKYMKDDKIDMDKLCNAFNKLHSQETTASDIQMIRDKFIEISTLTGIAAYQIYGIIFEEEFKDFIMVYMPDKKLRDIIKNDSEHNMYEVAGLSGKALDLSEDSLENKYYYKLELKMGLVDKKLLHSVLTSEEIANCNCNNDDINSDLKLAYCTKLAITLGEKMNKLKN